MSTLELHQVDAFTRQPFGGNPAAVVVLDAFPDDRWLQAVAAEMNLSETSFLVPGRGSDAYELRWFTPTTEVDLCGHATLAAAHVLWATERLDPGRAARFVTRSGELSAVRAEDGQIELDFPALPASATAAPARLAAALGVDAGDVRWFGRSRDDVLAVVADAATVAGLCPDLEALAGIDARGVIVTAVGDDDRDRSADDGERADFVSRFFAPRAGVPEDPVTGSAHCVLGPYWAERLGRSRLQARQLSRRRGELVVTVRGSRVGIAGYATTVVEGRLLAESARA